MNCSKEKTVFTPKLSQYAIRLVGFPEPVFDHVYGCASHEPELDQYDPNDIPCSIVVRGYVEARSPEEALEIVFTCEKFADLRLEMEILDANGDRYELIAEEAQFFEGEPESDF